VGREEKSINTGCGGSVGAISSVPRHHGGFSFSLVLFHKNFDWAGWNTREKADYSTFYVSAIIFNWFPAIKSLGSFR
jgi:hypothetical protein